MIQTCQTLFMHRRAGTSPGITSFASQICLRVSHGFSATSSKTRYSSRYAPWEIVNFRGKIYFPVPHARILYRPPAGRTGRRAIGRNPENNRYNNTLRTLHKNSVNVRRVTCHYLRDPINYAVFSDGRDGRTVEKDYYFYTIQHIRLNSNRTR